MTGDAERKEGFFAEQSDASIDKSGKKSVCLNDNVLRVGVDNDERHIICNGEK